MTNEEFFEKFAKERRIESRHGDDNNNYYDIRYGFLKACEIKDKEISELKSKLKTTEDRLREADGFIEESCLDDCALTLMECHRSMLEDIIMAQDKKARQYLSKYKDRSFKDE